MRRYSSASVTMSFALSHSSLFRQPGVCRRVALGLVLLGLSAGVLAQAQPSQPTVAAPGAATPAQTPAEPRFDILEFVVEGNTVLDSETIERLVYAHMGTGKRFDDVEAARAQLEAAYRKAGYGFASVDIPEQRADAGVIRLVVTEGRIARTRVTGARYFSQGYILERVSAAAEGQVPHLPTIQAQLLEVNRSSDRRVTPLLRPGKTEGTTEVDLAVEDKLPFSASISINNHASRNTSPTRLQAALSYDNLFQRDHSLSLQAVVSPEKPEEVKVVSAAYTVPMGKAGLESFAITATRSDSKVYVALNDTTLFGKGQVLGMRRSHLLEITEGSFHLLTLGVEYKKLGDRTVFGSKADDTPVTYLPMSLAWTGAFNAKGSDLQLGVTLSGGLRGLINRQEEFSDKRYQAKANYALLRLDARHNQALPWWGLRLRSQLETLFSPEPLISNEQFVLGGVSSVRGYHEAAAVGDLGLRASLQLATAELAPNLGWKALKGLSLHTFVEGAAAELRLPLPGQAQRSRLLGVGLGGQLSLGGPFPFNLALDVAWPLLKRDAIGADGMRAHASASFGF
jgi:hemolysin activation/secretion protein